MTQRLKALERTGSLSIAFEIRQIRERCGLSQQALAAELDYSMKQVIRWEAGLSIPRRIVLEAIRGLPEQRMKLRTRLGNASQFTFIDLFAGIGGLRRGFESIGGKCIFTSEWDRFSLRTYTANFVTDHPVAGDIVQIPSEVVPAHDVLLAGFPCQPFSLAGVSKKNALGRPHGFKCDTQGTLFFEIERILQHHRPRAFLLENVKHLLKHDGGRTWDVIMDALQNRLGYDVHFRVIDAAALLPQHRERVYIVGFRDRTPFDWNVLKLSPVTSGPRLDSILHPEDGSERPSEPYLDEFGKVQGRYTLSSHLWKYLKDYAAKHAAKGNGFGYSIVGPNDVARTLSARYHKDGSEILVRRGRGNPRRLTPRECARLMGFDPLLSEINADRFIIPVSDTQAYRQFGNSVAVPVVAKVAQAMLPFLADAAGQASQRPRQIELKLAS